MPSTPLIRLKRAAIVISLGLGWGGTVTAVADDGELRLESSPPLRSAHETITSYDGPSTCVACHATEATDAFHSVHYQQSGPTPNATNITGDAGKLNRGFNTYCGTPSTSRQFACAGCHVSYGKVPQPDATQEQFENIDCLMCHQDAYVRKPAPPFETVSYVDYLNVEHTWTLPAEDAAGNFNWEPDAAHMTITPLEAARTVHRPTRASCLRCHAYAAGSDCGKRGDLSTADINPSPAIDLHMSPAGLNLNCQDCHEFQNHKVLGRGLDLRPNDRPGRMTCLGCHPAQPHSEDGGPTIEDQHAARVACQTCHIPTYAKAMTTEVERNWMQPVWAQGLLGGQGGYKPEETRAANLVPTYKWYDGTSRVNVVGQAPPVNTVGEYEFGLPNGGPTLAAAQLYPMKEHWSQSARHDATGVIVPHATSTYFMTGDFAAAVADGMAQAGLTGSWTLVPVHTFQTINHGVVDHDQALACGACHTAYANGAPVRMNLVGDLGYQLKAPWMQVCTQCHEYESSNSFAAIHSKHVSSRHYDCRWCHTFSRPERNLTMPRTDVPGDVNCDGVVDFFDIDPFVTALTGANAYYAIYSCNWYNADANGDRQVDFFDIDAFVQLLTR